MSQEVKKINRFVKTAVKSDIDELSPKLLLTERQETIFNMYYIKDKDINFIADTLGVCNIVISNELKIIRKKMAKVLGYD